MCARVHCSPGGAARAGKARPLGCHRLQLPIELLSVPSAVSREGTASLCWGPGGGQQMPRGRGLGAHLCPAQGARNWGRAAHFSFHDLQKAMLSAGSSPEAEHWTLRRTDPAGCRQAGPESWGRGAALRAHMTVLGNVCEDDFNNKPMICF